MKHAINALIKHIEKELLPRYEDHILVHQYAWWMVEEITQQKQIDLILHAKIVLSQSQEEQLASWIHAQVVNHEPLAYLIGWVPFLNAKIFCKPPTLIPRPETEEWCEDLIENLEGHMFSILDLATGSGCIAIALAQAFPESRIYATDVANSALELAQQNAAYNKINNITFIQSDVYTNIPPNLRFDLIVSNPPYIPPEDWKSLDTSVSKWEDPHALTAPDHGLAIIKKIIADAHTWLKKDRLNNAPRLVIEIDHTQGPTVKELMEQAGFKNVEVKKDLAGKDRTVWGE